MGSPHPGAQQLSLYVSERLPLRTRETVEAHLAECAACRDKVDLGKTATPTGPRPAMAHASTDPQPGDMLGEYRVLEPLGGGGMGVLYRGEQPVIGKQVAIKVVRRAIAHDAEAVQRLIEEARAVNAIRHPNIVDIFSFGRLPDGRPYMVMELLEGLSLAGLLEEKGKLTPQQTLTVLSQALGALEAAHRVEVIHRDIKPENIFVDPRKDGWRVTLLDFGLAKRSSGGSDSLTDAGAVMGTPAYMAPEQIRAEKVTPAADIYALGVVAWKLLAGRGPFEEGSLAEVMQKHLSAPPPPLKPEAPGVPPELEALVMEMLAKDPLGRPTTAQARKRVEAMLGKATAMLPVAGRAQSSRLGLVASVIAAVVLAGITADRLLTPEPLPEIALVKPLPAPPAPIARVPPPGPVEEEHAHETPPPPEAKPLTEAEKAALTGFTWPCKKMLSLTPIYETGYLGQRWHAFQMKFSYENPLTLTTGPAVDRAGLKKAYAAMAACKGSDRIIAATNTHNFQGGFPMDDPAHPNDKTKQIWLQGGVRADFHDVRLIDAK